MSMYFLTDIRSRKYKQLEANPNVAICSGPLQIDGIASPKGHSRDPQNLMYLDNFKEKQLEGYESYLKNGFFDDANIWIIEIIPTKVEVFKSLACSDGAEMYLEILNIAKKKAFKVNMLEDGCIAPSYLE